MIQQQKRLRREEQILLRLNELNFATREHMQILENLGGDRNAHRILHRMEKDKAIASVRREKKIYYVSNRGKERIGKPSDKLMRDKITHTLMTNDIYITLGAPATWRRESRVKFNGQLIVSDASYTEGGRYVFVEVDNVQTMRSNLDKIKKYAELFRIIFAEKRQHPLLIWYSLSDLRKKRIADECTKNGVNYKLY